MPHKRAKHAARRTKREELGHDMAPTAPKRKSEMHDMPRKARELFFAPKRAAREEPAADASLRIRPTERLSDFNQRVEQTFASDINETMRRELRSDSNARKRQRRREMLKAKKRAANPLLARSEDADGMDFARASTSRSLHDVAQAPPTLTARPKERKKRDGVADAVEAQAARPRPSAARQRILDEERERVIAQYRAQKKGAVES